MIGNWIKKKEKFNTLKDNQLLTQLRPRKKPGKLLMLLLNKCGLKLTQVLKLR
jgi:hypothetical protein